MGKAGPASTPMIVRQGDRVRIRFVNLGMDHHPMHLHGYTFHVTGTEAGRIQPTAWWPGNTVLVGVAQARDVELLAGRPGDWMLHCHLPHHMMNQMSSRMNGTPLTNGPLSTARAMQAEVAKDANNVPGFPQDAYMEGPGMSMDARVDKPENYLLRPGWSGFMQGMMTFLRVPAPRKIRRRSQPHEAGKPPQRSLRLPAGDPLVNHLATTSTTKQRPNRTPGRLFLFPTDPNTLLDHPAVRATALSNNRQCKWTT